MPMMNVFEPLFILLALTAIGTVVTVSVLWMRGRRDRAVRVLRRLALSAAAYFAIVLLTAAVATPPVYHVGDQRCFDDWCITIVDARRAVHAATATWTVTLRLSSRAQRVAQRENGATVYLTDAANRRFEPVSDETSIPLDSQLKPGESLGALRRFELPLDATGVGLVFTHTGGFPIGSLIISENTWFHGPAIVRLDER